MNTRIEVDCRTGETKEIPLSEKELADAALARAREDEFNSIANVSERDIKGAFETDRLQMLQFMIEFDQENRIRALEGKPQITRAQYRDALISAYRTL